MPVSPVLLTLREQYYAGLESYRFDEGREPRTLAEAASTWVEFFCFAVERACERADAFERSMEQLRVRWGELVRARSGSATELLLDVLPGKTKNFFVPYAFVIFCIYLLFYAIFLAAYFMIIKSVDYKALILSPIIAAESAILIAILESRFPITTWKTEPDLLHHPRKYIVPVIIMLESTLVYFLPF